VCSSDLRPPAQLRIGCFFYLGRRAIDATELCPELPRACCQPCSAPMSNPLSPRSPASFAHRSSVLTDTVHRRRPARCRRRRPGPLQLARMAPTGAPRSPARVRASGAPIWPLCREHASPGSSAMASPAWLQQPWA